MLYTMNIAVFETFFKEYIGQIVAKATSTFCVTTAPLRQYFAVVVSYQANG